MGGGIKTERERERHQPLPELNDSTVAKKTFVMEDIHLKNLLLLTLEDKLKMNAILFSKGEQKHFHNG